jgi:hypothetical protein
MDKVPTSGWAAALSLQTVDVGLFGQGKQLRARGWPDHAQQLT